jgi:SAP domain
MSETQTAQLFTNPVAASAFAAHRAAQIEEFGTYVAAETILVGSVAAWHEGHPVPKSTVEANPWLLEKVRRVAPPPQPGMDRAEQLRARQQALAEEAAAIAAELARAEQDAADEPAQYRGLNVEALRDELRRRELKVSGNRPDLIARLAGDDATRAEPAGEPDDENGE